MVLEFLVISICVILPNEWNTPDAGWCLSARLAAVPAKLLCAGPRISSAHESVAGAIENFESPNVRQGDEGARLEPNSRSFAPATGSARHVGRLFLEEQTEIAEAVD